MKIAFTGGGTLGHVLPCLTIAHSLDKNIDVFYLSSKKQNEVDKIKESMRVYKISSGKLRRYFSLNNFFDIFKILIGFIQSFFILLKEKPDLLFSKGGYVSVPVVLASYILKIKIITHESDITMGLANKINSKFAKYVLHGFAIKEDEKNLYSGNPIREDLYKIDREKTDRLNILVLGGSLGSLSLNNMIYKTLDNILPYANVYHQAGPYGDFSIKKDNYEQVEFISDEYNKRLNEADLVISRSGANAISEFIYLQKAVILVPLKQNASRGEQILNAEYLVKNNAAILCLNEEEILNKVCTILENRSIIDEMEKNMASLNKIDAKKFIIDLINKEIQK